MMKSIQTEGVIVTFSDDTMNLSEVLSHQLYKLQINILQQCNSSSPHCFHFNICIAKRLIKDESSHLENCLHDEVANGFPRTA